MLFALFGLGWGEIIALGLCCGFLGIGVAAVVAFLLLTGKRSADPDDTKRNRAQKARREQTAEEDDKPANKDTGFTAEKPPGQDAADAGADQE